MALNIDIPGYSFSFSVDGRMTGINELMQKDLGYEQSEVIGKLRFEELLTGGSRIFFKTHFLPILMMEGKVNEMFLSFGAKTGEELPVLMNLLLTAQNEIQGIVGIGIQIEKRNKFEKGLIEAKRAAEIALTKNEMLIKMKSKLEQSKSLMEQQLRDLKRINQEHLEFSKILAHDMQEPLRKMRLFASVIDHKTNKTDLNPEVKPYFEKIIALSKHGHELLARLQQYYALEDRMDAYSSSNIDTMLKSAVLNLGCNQIKPDLTELKAKKVNGDITKLSWVFQELLLNAYQFRSQERTLCVKISSEYITDNYYSAMEGAYRYTDFIKINFKDNSRGFPGHAQKKLFHLLQKYHPNSGKGFGLAYCKKIIDLHYGSISMKSKTDKGSEFVILLPVKGSQA
ncbi:MAG: PAS domain S-box protein [Pricia sp.]|nr:PAS domain S-box protein [Pricia sp.]